MQNEFKDKVVLVTGGTGTIGSKLVEEILSYQPKQVRVVSRDESKQYALLEKLRHPSNLRLFIGDIRDKERLLLAFRGVDIVFHAAALKHVPFCEYNPFEAVKTNIIGSQNVIDAALAHRVKKVVAISTDKVVNPVGVMGVSKLMMEKLFINANYYKGDDPTIFSCVRFGNVTWARGSVFTLWKEQAARDRAIKVTDEQMTRFMMSPADATHLVCEAARHMRGGEVFIFKMPAIRMVDAARLFLEKYHPNSSVRIDVIGNRGGEKTHEELFCGGDSYDQVLEGERMFIIIPRVPIYELEDLPQIPYAGFREVLMLESYSSRDHVSIEEVAKIM
ncbi:MAG: polysaccharide biosynthesis protein CapD [Parcubacteria group bacterium Gr01-1014_33]|nr:MAG: polysaccharide biosynthesis protein CapD [Parcubacteria group bacterium Gr01-1014_33]